MATIFHLKQAPFIMKRRANGTVTFYGYCVDLIKDIQAIMGFEYELYEVPDGKYGNMDSKMNWNGMIKELMEKVDTIWLAPISANLGYWPKIKCNSFYPQTEGGYRIRSSSRDGRTWERDWFHGALLRFGGHQHFDGQAASLHVLVQISHCARERRLGMHFSRLFLYQVEIFFIV